MFDSGGSSGQLRDELGVLPPGDVLKCALALARNEAEARRVLLSRVPSIDPRLAGHTGGNLLLSMMERYSGDFLVCRRRAARRCSAASGTSGRSASSRRACAPSTATGRRRAAKWRWIAGRAAVSS